MRRSQNRYSGYRGRRTANDLLKRIALVLAVLVALVLGGLFLGQDYIVFTDNGLRLDLPFFRPQAQEPLVPGSVSVVVRPKEAEDKEPEDRQPEDQPAVPEEAMAAVELPVSALQDGTAAQRLEEAGANSLILGMKDREGRLAWRSQQELAVHSGVPMGTGESNEALRLWNEGEVYTVARVCCFRDNTLPYQRNEVALRAGYGNWRDELGLRWLNPDSQTARTYLADLCEELAQLGFDEILLECCQFPCRGNLEAIVPDGSFADGGFEAVMAGFLSQLGERLEPYGTVLSLRADREALTDGAAGSGLTAAALESGLCRIWMEEDGREPSPAALLSRAGLSEAEGRLVALVPALGGESSVPQAVLEETT